MSKERKFPPLIINPSSLAEKNQPLLTPDVMDATAAPAATPTSNAEIRGLYSEYILKPRQTPLLPPLKSPKKSPISATFIKAPPLKPIFGNYISTDQHYKAVTETNYREKQHKLDYRLALEPKVQLPFEGKPGDTPRKIEIERKKRLFSTQNIQSLIENAVKNIFEEKDISQYSQQLNYEIFDDTEFEQRTITEWLNLKLDNESSESLEENNQVDDWVDKSAPKHILFAKLPIPAVALRRKSWIPCLVTAYDTLKNLWKVKWIKTSGWQLEFQADQDDESDFDVEDDEENVESTKESLDRNKRVLWLHRLNILFLAEDPFNFAKRFAASLANREDAANYLVNLIKT